MSTMEKETMTKVKARGVWALLTVAGVAIGAAFAGMSFARTSEEPTDLGRMWNHGTVVDPEEPFGPRQGSVRAY